MADLADADDLSLLLGLSEGQAQTDDALLTALLDQAEALFEAECDRTETPFTAALTARVEKLDAVGNTRLWLDYPIASIAAVVLGVDVADPDETLDATDARVVAFQVGKRILTRTDGGVWSAGSGVLSWARGGPVAPCGDYNCGPSFVQVTYTTQEDLPAVASAAVVNLAAQMYRTQGTEGITSETLDNYSASFAKTAQTVPGWSAAVMQCRRLVAL